MKIVALICVISTITACEKAERINESGSGRNSSALPSDSNAKAINGAAALMSKQEINNLHRLAQRGSGWAYVVLAQEAERAGNYGEANNLRQRALDLEDPGELIRRISAEVTLASSSSNDTNNCSNLRDIEARLHLIIQSIPIKTVGMSSSAIENLVQWSREIESNLDALTAEQC